MGSRHVRRRPEMSGTEQATIAPPGFMRTGISSSERRPEPAPSFVPAAFRDQLHGGLAYPGVARRTRAMKAFALGKRRDIAIFVHRLVRDKS